MLFGLAEGVARTPSLLYSKTCPYRNALGQTFIPVWTGSGLERVFASGEEQKTITCTIDMRVIIQDVSSVGLQMIGGCICK